MRSLLVCAPPRPPVDDGRHALLRQAIRTCEIGDPFARGVALTNRRCVLRGQSRAWVPLARRPSILRVHVLDVRGGRREPEMSEPRVVHAVYAIGTGAIIPHAAGVVATVPNIAICRRPCSGSKKPGDAVRLADLPIHQDAAIPVVVRGPRPQPTICRALHLGPEPGFDRQWPRVVRGTAAAAVATGGVSPGHERLPAKTTRAHVAARAATLTTHSEPPAFGMPRGRRGHTRAALFAWLLSSYHERSPR